MKATTEYAVLVALCLASYGGMRSAKEIASLTGLPAATVVQTTAKLRQARLMHSVRGYAGGYCLARSADDISLLDIFEAMEERRVFAASAFEASSPSRLKIGSDPVSERGASRLAAAMRSLPSVGLRVSEVLEEETLDRLVLGREGPGGNPSEHVVVTGS